MNPHGDLVLKTGSKNTIASHLVYKRACLILVSVIRKGIGFRDFFFLS